MIDLVTLLPLDTEDPHPLEWYVGSCLCAGGLWDSPRVSDGLAGIGRVLARLPGELRLWGRIYQIDQTLRTFWLEIERHASGERVEWRLYVDVAEVSERRARNALTSNDRPEDIPWRTEISGVATLENGVLAIVPDSTEVVVNEMPAPEPPRERGRRRTD